MSSIIEGIFGGGEPDNSAERIAQAQLEAQKQAQAAEQSRWEREQARVASDKAAAEAKYTQDEEKRKQEIERNKIENQKQIEAQAATGQGATFENTRSDAAKALAAAQTGGIQLPGYKSLSALAANQGGGYQGQQNTITSPTGFNAAKVGGRRYV